MRCTSLIILGVLGVLTYSPSALADNDCDETSSSVTSDLAAVVRSRPAQSGSTQHFDSSNFQSAVLDAKGPVLVDIYADWCGPCRQLAPVIDQVAREMGDRATVGKLNYDHSSNIARQYGVSSLPTVLIFNDGKLVGRTVGVMSAQSYKDMLNKYVVDDEVVEQTTEQTTEQTGAGTETVEQTGAGTETVEQTGAGTGATGQTGAGTGATGQTTGSTGGSTGGDTGDDQTNQVLNQLLSFLQSLRNQQVTEGDSTGSAGGGAGAVEQTDAGTGTVEQTDAGTGTAEQTDAGTGTAEQTDEGTGTAEQWVPEFVEGPDGRLRLASPPPPGWRGFRHPDGTLQTPRWQRGQWGGRGAFGRRPATTTQPTTGGAEATGSTSSTETTSTAGTAAEGSDK